MILWQNLEGGIFWLSTDRDGVAGWRGKVRREKRSGLKVIFKDDWLNLRFWKNLEIVKASKLALILTIQLCIPLMYNEGYFCNCPTLHMYILNKWQVNAATFYALRKITLKDALIKLIIKQTVKIGGLLVTDSLIGMTQTLTKPYRKVTSSPHLPQPEIGKRQMYIPESTFWFHPNDWFEAGQCLVL